MMWKVRDNAVAIIVSVLLVAGIVLMTIETAPIKVLRDFTISTDKTNYSPGSLLVITSKATKIRKASGIVHRTVECDNGIDRIVDYAINVSDANKPPGRRDSPYSLVLPNQIANLPATCRIVVRVDYHIFSINNLHLRTVTQYAVTNDFVIQ